MYNNYNNLKKIVRLGLITESSTVLRTLTFMKQRMALEIFDYRR